MAVNSSVLIEVHTALPATAGSIVTTPALTGTGLLFLIGLGSLTGRLKTTRTVRPSTSNFPVPSSSCGCCTRKPVFGSVSSVPAISRAGRGWGPSGPGDEGFVFDHEDLPRHGGPREGREHQRRDDEESSSETAGQAGSHGGRIVQDRRLLRKPWSYAIDGRHFGHSCSPRPGGDVRMSRIIASCMLPTAAQCAARWRIFRVSPIMALDDARARAARAEQRQHTLVARALTRLCLTLQCRPRDRPSS